SFGIHEMDAYGHQVFDVIPQRVVVAMAVMVVVVAAEVVPQLTEEWVVLLIVPFETVKVKIKLEKEEELQDSRYVNVFDPDPNLLKSGELRREVQMFDKIDVNRDRLQPQWRASMEKQAPRRMAARRLDEEEQTCYDFLFLLLAWQDECKRVSTEGQNLRLDLSTKFHDAIKEVSIRLEGQKDECLSQLKENEMLRSKLKQLADQYALSEQQHAQMVTFSGVTVYNPFLRFFLKCSFKVLDLFSLWNLYVQLKQKTLELQIADLKIQQHEEKLLQEQSQMKLYAEQVSQLLATEKNLRLQLTADGEKFQQFQVYFIPINIDP
ncbi:hypothetical protein C3L33_22564, partial [Rhododendron williamsianum]